MPITHLWGSQETILGTFHLLSVLTSLNILELLHKILSADDINIFYFCYMVNEIRSVQFTEYNYKIMPHTRTITKASTEICDPSTIKINIITKNRSENLITF